VKLHEYLADDKVFAVLKYQAINMYGRVAIKLRVFLTLALDKGEKQVSHSGPLSSGTSRLSGHGIEGRVTSQLMVMPEPHFSRKTDVGLRLYLLPPLLPLCKSFSTCISSSHLNPTFLVRVVKDKFVPVICHDDVGRSRNTSPFSTSAQDGSE
jgi:hypothetical protein